MGPRVAGVTTLFIALAWAIALADVVELTTGQRVEGTFQQATPRGVSIEVGGQTITFEQEKVRAIYFGSAPAAAVPPSPAREALLSLKALQSVTRAGIAYREYSQRVNDAKIQVDRVLDELPGDALDLNALHQNLYAGLC